MEEYEIRYYVGPNRKSPFVTWILSLGTKTRVMLTKRIARIRDGNLGDVKPLKGHKGVYELRVHSGPGYRIYFGKRKKIVVVLLCGGTKGSQKKDITKASEYWKDYIQNNGD